MYADGSFIAHILEYHLDKHVITHEVAGHGIGRLEDEYVEPGYELISPDEGYTLYLDNNYSRESGWWGANIDYRNNPSTVRWAKLLQNPKYANEIGIFEDAGTFGRGVYRSSENSMMRHQSICPWFNAPSRMNIYKNVMMNSEGDSWDFNYDEFLKFDESLNIQMPVQSRVGISEKEQKNYMKHHSRPKLINSTWNEYFHSKR